MERKQRRGSYCLAPTMMSRFNGGRRHVLLVASTALWFAASSTSYSYLILLILLILLFSSIIKTPLLRTLLLSFSIQWNDIFWWLSRAFSPCLFPPIFFFFFFNIYFCLNLNSR